MTTVYHWRTAFILLVGLILSGCVYPPTKYDGAVAGYKHNKRHKPLHSPVRQRAKESQSKRTLLARGASVPLWPHLIQPPYVEKKLGMFSRFGQNVLRIGSYYVERAHFLRRQCNQRGADRNACKIYWKSQKIFSINYHTRRKNYRGYVTFHRQRKRLIPRSLMRWYRRLSREKYRKPKGRCYLEYGLISNCMSFSMCSQKEALQRFQGRWGKGFDAPAWGNINYWSSRAYYRHYYDYRKQGQRRPGIRTFQRKYSRWSRAKRQRKARILLHDVMDGYVREVRRRTRSRWSRRVYGKAFCTNIVAGMGDFRRAIPGDMFGYAYLRKRGRRRRTRIHFQHWGLIVDPVSGKVLHNQTPGGMWGRQFRRWGIQYGYYRGRDFRSRWRWSRRRRRYSKRLFFVNRVNVHFYQFARSRGANIYNARGNRSICRDWINKYADVYLTGLADPLPKRQSNNPYLSLLPPTHPWTQSTQPFVIK